MFPKITAYLIRCSTGCTCCRSENELHGPFQSLEDAQDRAESFSRSRMLASQYAPNGVYEIESIEAEQLPDGRLILGNTLIAERLIGPENWSEPLLFGDKMDLLVGERVRTKKAA